MFNGIFKMYHGSRWLDFHVVTCLTVTLPVSVFHDSSNSVTWFTINQSAVGILQQSFYYSKES